ncbi:MAG: porin family protein [Alphaproteobacteria bacterium]
MKKLLFGTALGVMCCMAPAMAANQSGNSPFTGLYVGAYGGYDWSDADTTVAGFNPDLDGWDGGFFAGYRLDSLMRNNDMGFNAAIEAFYGWSNSDDSVGALYLEKEDEWGVSFRPGLSFIEDYTFGASPYAIFGYRNTEYRASAGALTGTEDYDGFELGIGAQLLAHGNIGLRLEYAHVWYSEENGIDPDSDNVRLGLSYHF